MWDDKISEKGESSREEDPVYGGATNVGMSVPFAITFNAGQGGNNSVAAFGIIINYSITASSGLPAGYPGAAELLATATQGW